LQHDREGDVIGGPGFFDPNLSRHHTDRHDLSQLSPKWHNRERQPGVITGVASSVPRPGARTLCRPGLRTGWCRCYPAPSNTALDPGHKATCGSDDAALI
jgi:hypothetical protein